ncbi:hypothetical protein EHV15_36075 [Paenibacillus oralis]|uniref:RepB family plasmid replication initiator protein n=1 Tax=Paenibacillus oralis TaxID=2490856 RepID=A0A3P3TCZ0_9BACL|nr:hypothetical protein [Paenibacillus oralis]RRJ54988.1 hypothetical protein EHV15_36075 [Paenibacillus oralis]
MKVDKDMSKFNDLLSNEIDALAKKKLDMLNYRIDAEKIDRMMEADLQRVAKGLMSSNLHELKPVLEKFRNKETELLKRFLTIQGSGQNISDMEHHEQIRYDLITKTIEIAIQMKREYRKQYNSHILEKNLIQGGVFLSGTPHAATMNKLTGGDILELERRGFRPMVYRNDNGAILNSYDTRVLIGLFKLWLTQGKKKQIQFEFKELAEAMVTKTSGGEYRLIYESLKNIAATWVEYKEYFDPNSSNFYSATIKHRPIKSMAWIARTKEEEGGKERAAIVSFHEELHESLLAGNYVFINMVIYNELPTSYARLIYLNILDAIESGITQFELDTLIDHIILKDGDDEAFNRARTIRTIETSFGHLMDADVITDFSLKKTGRKFTHINFVPSDWLQGHRNTATAELDTSISLQRPVQITMLEVPGFSTA